MHHEEIVASKTLNIDLQNEVRFGDTGMSCSSSASIPLTLSSSANYDVDSEVFGRL